MRRSCCYGFSVLRGKRVDELVQVLACGVYSPVLSAYPSVHVGARSRQSIVVSSCDFWLLYECAVLEVAYGHEAAADAAGFSVEANECGGFGV